MYVYKRQVTMQRGIATLLAIALVLWVTGAHMFTSVEAANLTYIKDTLSDSDSGSLSNHTVDFLSPTGVTAGQTITLAINTSFTGTSSVRLADLDLEVSGVDKTLVVGAPAAAEWGVSTSSSNSTFTFTAGASESLAALATATIKIGSNATAGGSGTSRLTNPAATTSYEFTATAGSGADTGQFRVAIVDNVLVTANVDTTLTFVVYGTSTGAVLNSSPTTTYATSTYNTLAFGTLANSVSKTLGQD